MDVFVIMLGYGMTELTMASHINPRFHRKSHTVGVVTPNTRFKVNKDISVERLGRCYRR